MKYWVWTTKNENVSQEFKECKEFVENDNLIIEVKDNLLIKFKESCNELQLQIEELEKQKLIIIAVMHIIL